MAERYYIATERNTQHWRCVRCRGFRGEISKKKCKSQNQKAAAGEGHAGGGGRGERAAGRGVSGTSADAAQDRAPFLKTGIGTPPRAGALKARKSCRLRQRSDTRHYWRNVVYTSMDTSSKLLVSQATYQEEDELRGTVSEGEAKGKSHSNPNPTWIREMGTSCLVTDDSNLLLSKSPKSGQQFQEEGK